MELVLYSCKAKLSSYFRQKRLQRSLLLGLGIIASGFYSWLFSFLLLQAQQGDIDLTAAKVISYANLLILAITILRGFFPAYIPKTEFIHRLYPVKAFQKFWVELVVELASPFYFVLANFFLILFMMSPAYSFLHLLQSITVLLTAHITKRSFQVIIERKIQWRSINFLSAAVMAGAFLAVQARSPMFEPAASWPYLGVHLVAAAFFLVSNYLLEQAALEPKRRTVNYSQDARRGLGWRLFTNHKMAKQLLLFGLVLKAFMLAMDAIAFSMKGVHIFDKNPSVWLFMGPLVIYSYVFNNVWGFYKNLWLTTERTSGNYMDFVKVSLLSIRLPLLLDAGIVLLYLALFNHEKAYFIIPMYIASVLALTPIGIIASIVSPKVVRGGIMSFTAKTSYLFSIISILTVGLLFLPLLHPLLFLVYPVVIAVALFAAVAVIKEYPKYKYKMFETLYKTEA
ncbi:hypothetical protein [Pontibacter sp. SGAir0037]|uniref:hypothetical protein n=1 Tax=Pontibacter sp. SGAir0037 TaxID=2571030 RepID=UPI0010CD6555|nr:hypothetical protein [Pontibacter sp. SGAir0037]QCR21152.1 hypothetical protein C1N53_01465 [Pontibacter sp. SGAir0037]